MLPPDWELTREQITSMSNDELSQFDVEVFMQSYREKMTKVNKKRNIEFYAYIYLFRLLNNVKLMKLVGVHQLNVYKLKLLNYLILPEWFVDSIFLGFSSSFFFVF